MNVVAVLAVVLGTATLAHAAPPTDAELESCIGKTGSEIPAFAALHRGMTTDEANAALPGSGKVDKYGFATMKPKDCPGAAGFKFFFLKDRTSGALGLYSGQIDFQPKLTNDKEFYSRLVTLLAGKFGEIKDPKQIDKKLITWATSDGIAQLTTLGKGRSLELHASLKK